MRLIDEDALVNCFKNKGAQIIFDLPVQEVLGEDIDLDDFAMLVQDAVQAYKAMVIDTIKNQPTAYDTEKVERRLEEMFKHHNASKTVKRLVLEIVRKGGKE